MTLFLDILAIAFFGAIGALSRYGITSLAIRIWGENFPIGTLLVNVGGCLLIGMLIGSGIFKSNERLQLATATGFLGSLTTFSTFGADTVKLMQDGQWQQGGLNIALNLILGLFGIAIGIILGAKLSGR